METRRPAAVPSVKGREWDTPLSFCRVEAAMASGNVWVWKSMTMGKTLSFRRRPHVRSPRASRWGTSTIFIVAGKGLAPAKTRVGLPVNRDTAGTITSPATMQKRRR